MTSLFVWIRLVATAHADPIVIAGVGAPVSTDVHLVTRVRRPGQVGLSSRRPCHRDHPGDPHLLVLCGPSGLSARVARMQRFWAPGALHGSTLSDTLVVVLPDHPRTSTEAAALLADLSDGPYPAQMRVIVHAAEDVSAALRDGPYGPLTLTVPVVDAAAYAGESIVRQAGGHWVVREGPEVDLVVGGETMGTFAPDALGAWGYSSERP